MKESKLIFTHKYNYGIIEVHYQPWFIPMCNFRYFMGKNIKIERGIQDEDQ